MTHQVIHVVSLLVLLVALATGLIAALGPLLLGERAGRRASEVRLPVALAVAGLGILVVDWLAHRL